MKKTTITSINRQTIKIYLCSGTATSEIYTLSLHDALPISRRAHGKGEPRRAVPGAARAGHGQVVVPDRKSTRLNSSHVETSYAVFCLKKKTAPTETT